MSSSSAAYGWRGALIALARRREAQAIALLCVLLGIFCVLLFAIRGEEIGEFDLAVTRGIQSVRLPWLDEVAVFFTHCGDFPPFAVIGGAVIARLLTEKRRGAALFCALTFLGHPVNYLIKLIAQRPRPTEDMVAVIMKASGTSFPSGHAMASLMFYGFLAFLAWVLLLKPGRLRFWVVVGLVALIVLIGVSRIYVGGHWFSDVIGGWVCGLFFLILLTEGYRIFTPQPEHTPY